MSKLRDAIDDYFDYGVQPGDGLVAEVESDPDKLLAYWYWDSGENFGAINRDQIASEAQDMMSRSGDDGYRAIYFDNQGNRYVAKVTEAILVRLN